MTLKDINPDRPIIQPTDTSIPRVELEPKVCELPKPDIEKKKPLANNEQPNQPL